ncbi:MAG: helix-turn-helix domain-containing protein [Pseudomonadota bacterium]
MQITLLLYPDFSNHCLANTLEPLRAANDLSGEPLFTWSVVSRDGAPVASSSGLRLQVDGALAEARGDMLIAQPSYGFRGFATPAGRAGLRAARTRFSTLAGFDTGAWLLADAGLLDGYRATVHWEELEDMAEAFPEVTALRTRFLWDRDRLTCAGASAAFDAMGDLIERVGGPALRLEVALLFVTPDVAAEPAAPMATSAVMAQVLGVMQDNLEEPLPVGEIARRVGVSPRSLDRLAQRELGSSPAQTYARLRLLRARKLVRETRLSVAEIAVRSGYQDASAFTRAFRQAFGHAPRMLRSGASGS